MSRDTTRCVARLARWLGPWTPDSAIPTDVERREIPIPTRGPDDRPFRARVYAPAGRPPIGALLLVPGLHYAGPDDVRMDRFAAILANAGLLVLAPFLPDFARLRVGPGLMGDVERSFDVLRALPERPGAVRPGVFSISFGSLPALHLAAAPPRAEQVGGLVVFGGYADWGETLRFCLEGAPGRPHDPLNRPVVFMNLLEHMRGLPEDIDSVTRAWDRFVRRTWGRPEMKVRERWEAVAREEARDLSDAEKRLFLLGCGLEPGGAERCAAALERAGNRFDWLDPRPRLSTLRCPVYLVHGRDDDVIPHTQAARLAEAMPGEAEVHTMLTGMYAHTSTMGLRELAALAPAAVGELRSMVGILRAIARVATSG